MFVKSTWQVLIWFESVEQPDPSFETTKCSSQTLNFLGKNIELCHENRKCFICDRSSLVSKRRYWMSPPFTNRSPRFVKQGLSPRFTNLSSQSVKHGLSPRFPGPVQSVFYKFSPRLVKHGLSPRFPGPVRSSQVLSVFYNMPSCAGKFIFRKMFSLFYIISCNKCQKQSIFIKYFMTWTVCAFESRFKIVYFLWYTQYV
jgi:hypothetical protein